MREFKPYGNFEPLEQLRISAPKARYFSGFCSKYSEYHIYETRTTRDPIRIPIRNVKHETIALTDNYFVYCVKNSSHKICIYNFRKKNTQIINPKCRNESVGIAVHMNKLLSVSHRNHIEIYDLKTGNLAKVVHLSPEMRYHATPRTAFEFCGPCVDPTGDTLMCHSTRDVILYSKDEVRRVRVDNIVSAHYGDKSRITVHSKGCLYNLNTKTMELMRTVSVDDSCRLMVNKKWALAVCKTGNAWVDLTTSKIVEPSNVKDCVYFNESFAVSKEGNTLTFWNCQPEYKDQEITYPNLRKMFFCDSCFLLGNEQGTTLYM